MSDNNTDNAAVSDSNTDNATTGDGTMDNTTTGLHIMVEKPKIQAKLKPPQNVCLVLQNLQ